MKRINKFHLKWGFKIDLELRTLEDNPPASQAELFAQMSRVKFEAHSHLW